MSLLIDRHVWSFILTAYLFVLSISCLALAGNLSITSKKSHRLGSLLALVCLSAVLIYHLTDSLIKLDLMLSPLFGVWLFYIALFSESQQNNTRHHRLIIHALMGCAFLLFLFGVLLLAS